MSLTVCAIIAVRNEAPYLKYLLPWLAHQEIEVVVIDHDSDDETRSLLEYYHDSPVIAIERLAYSGIFSLEEQLAAKRRVIEQLRHDWVIHHDADEVLEHCNPGQTLRAAIEEADGFGSTAINFEEFTFIPEPGKDYTGRDYYLEMGRYYFFEKSKNRLHRAWRRNAGLDNRTGAGHVLVGRDIRMCPYTHVLRHYITLSQEHVWGKYLGRSFAPAEIGRGWHRNRLQLTKQSLQLPEKSRYLQTLMPAPKGCLCRSEPASCHYWDWRAIE